MKDPAQLFAINPDAAVHVETTAAGVPVLIIDDFYLDPHGVRREALGGQYDASLAYYPGMHSRIAPEAINGLFAALSRMLVSLGETRVRPEYFWSDFSIVTTPAAQMLAKQKHPHIDPTPLAGLVYLNQDYEVGTCFFRHNPTGLAVVRDDEENARFYEWMEAYGEQYQPQTYAIGDDGIWQRLYTIQGRFNRFVLYPGNAFHSIDMRDVAADPTMEKARLTQRLFVTQLDTPPQASCSVS